MGTEAETSLPVRVIVCDTGPILHLMEVEALHLLNAAGSVVVPHAVDDELVARNPDWCSARPQWVRVEDPAGPFLPEAERLVSSGILHRGEAYSLLLARQTEADWYLTDDAAARILGSTLGLEVHGSLGIVLWPAAAGHLDCQEAAAYLERLAGSTLWISSRVLEEAKSALRDLLG